MPTQTTRPRGRPATSVARGHAETVRLGVVDLHDALRNVIVDMRHIMAAANEIERANRAELRVYGVRETGEAA